MWLFTTFGFFSITASTQDKGQLVVRARVRDDLVKLLDLFLPPARDRGLSSQIIETPDRDYPYRIVLWRQELADFLARYAEMMAYTNFKGAVNKAQGHARHDLYMDVWRTMNNAEAKLAAAEAGKPAPKRRSPRKRAKAGTTGTLKKDMASILGEEEHWTDQQPKGKSKPAPKGSEPGWFEGWSKVIKKAR